jgi:hypothetical protein
MNITRVEQLIDRIAANETGGGEFAEFERLASSEPSQWERLARVLRDEVQLRAAAAEMVDAPVDMEIDRAIERSREAASGVVFRFGTWGGWAVAACVALAWIAFSALTPPPVPPMNEQPQFALASYTADDALEHYLWTAGQEGRIVAELPSLMVESRPMADGRLEVYYVRQLLERDEVASVYEITEDEHGQPAAVPVSPAFFQREEMSL